MKVVLLTSSIYAIPTLNSLANENMLQAVVSVSIIHPMIMQIEQTAKVLNIPFKHFSKKQLLTDFKTWLEEMQTDMVIVFGMRYKISPELFAIPRLGFYNVHFSLLPAFRGSNPVFWQLKNGDDKGGITMHKVTEEYDAGPILMQHTAPVFQGENFGIYSGRLSLESAAMISKGIEKLKYAGDKILVDQHEEISYYNAPSADDLKINWETQSARDIENLVNASNPEYGGAITLLRGQVFKIFEVSPAEINNPAEFSPGSIVHSDTNYGLFVACKDSKFLRINIIQSSEGILSGFKLASLGVSAGERFDNA